MKPSNLFLLCRILSSPLEALYMLLIFIAVKDLHASLFQIAVLASLKPVVSLFAFYASSFLHGKPQSIRNYLRIFSVLGCLPCFLFHYIDNVWFYVIAYGIYMLGVRAVYPAWIELLKEELDLKALGKVISRGTSINYFITIFVPLVLAYWMDHHLQIWKSLFFALAVLQLFTFFATSCLPHTAQKALNASNASRKSRHVSLLPFSESWSLLRSQPSFRKYLALFFLGGMGLVAIQSIIPLYFHEKLNLTYQELTIAISLCKGIAFVLTSPVWAPGAAKLSIYHLNGYINIFSCLFISFLLAASAYTPWLFLAYLMYGTMQAGCELSWNVCGPLFSQENESSLYSSINLLFIGIRGCVCPFLGQLLFHYGSFFPSFIFAGSLCLLGVFYAFFLDYQEKTRRVRLRTI